MASGRNKEPSKQAARQRRAGTTINTENDLYQALEDDLTEVSMMGTTQSDASNEQSSMTSTRINDQVKVSDHASCYKEITRGSEDTDNGPLSDDTLSEDKRYIQEEGEDVYKDESTTDHPIQNSQSKPLLLMATEQGCKKKKASSAPLKQTERNLRPCLMTPYHYILSLRRHPWNLLDGSHLPSEDAPLSLPLMEPVQRTLLSRSHVVTHIIPPSATPLVPGLIMCHGGDINDYPRVAHPVIPSCSQLVVGTIWNKQQQEEGSGQAIQRRFPRYNTIDYNYERMVMLVVPGGVSTIHCLNIVWRAMSGPIINNYSFMMFVSGLIIDCIDFYIMMFNMMEIFSDYDMGMRRQRRMVCYIIWCLRNGEVVMWNVCMAPCLITMVTPAGHVIHISISGCE